MSKDPFELEDEFEEPSKEPEDDLPDPEKADQEDPFDEEFHDY